MKLFMWAFLSVLVYANSFKIQNVKRQMVAGALGVLGLGIRPSHGDIDGFNEAIKLRNVPAAKFAKIVEDDITIRQALITADFSRNIYSESATFKDEIDTYPIEKYIMGTKALFVPEKSHVDLTSPVHVDDDKATFKFKETLTFNIPLITPAVDLTGNVELLRGEGGLVVKSIEHWDRSPTEVLKTARFFQ